MAERAFVRFPPKWRNVLVPVAPRRATTVGLSLYSASKPSTIVLQRGLWAATAVLGSRALPGRRDTWTPPVPADVLDELSTQWRSAIGTDYDALAVYERLQSARAAMTVLVCAGDRSMLVRVRDDDRSFEKERRISDTARRLDVRGIRVPTVVGSGTAGGWHWIGYQAMSTRPHVPRYSLPTAALDQVSALVEAVVPRGADTPPHWRGAHCDLTPWNLRRSGRSTWLIDWEEAQWAPPGTDAVFLKAVVAAMGHGRIPRRHDAADGPGAEARAFCARLAASRAASSRERHLHVRLLQALGADADA